MEGDAVSKATSSVGYLVGFQFISRIGTFLLNLIVVRKVSPAVFGIGNGHLQLFLTIALLLTREGYRKAITRFDIVNNTKKNDPNHLPIPSLIRIIWSVVPLGLVVTFTTFYLTITWRSEEELLFENYELFFIIASFAVILEIFSEPFWIIMQMLFCIKQRVSIEALAMFVKCISISIFVYFEMGLLSFAWGQVGYSIILLLGFIYYFKKNVGTKENGKPFPFKSFRELFPIIPSSFSMDERTKETFTLVLSFTWQSFEKLLLQESEKLVLKFTNTLTDQGIFSVVSNLGSLVVRFLFQPVEEIGFTLFGKLLTETNKKQKDKNLIICSRVLVCVLKLMILIGLVFICFGMNYSTALLELLYGEKYGRLSSAPSVLSIYCILVFFMAINGITEGFFSASASPKQVKYHNIAMVIFSIIYIIVCIFLVKYYGTTGLVFANCVNMFGRICFSLYFIKRNLYDTKTSGLIPFKSSIPHPILLVSFIISFVITRLSEYNLYINSPFSFIIFLQHTSIGCICLLITLIIFYVKEKEFIKSLKSLRHNKTE